MLLTPSQISAYNLVYSTRSKLPLANDTVTLALQVGDTVYTAEFSRRDLKPDTLKDGDQVQAEVKHGNLIVKLKNGKKVSARVHWVQRAIIHPLPETL